MKKKIKRMIVCFIMVAVLVLLGTLTVSATTETESNTEPVSDEVLPDGVYSFWNFGSGFYMDVRNNSDNSGAILQQRSYQDIPASEANRSALFRVEHISETEYSIRPLNNTLHALFYVSSRENIETSFIRLNNLRPGFNWTITRQEVVGDYGIYMVSNTEVPIDEAPLYLSAQDKVSSGSGDEETAAKSSLVMQSEETAGELCLWVLDRYVGSTFRDVEIECKSSQLLDENSAVSIADYIGYEMYYSTVVGENTPGTITGYTIADVTGNATNAATISSAGVITTQKPGTVKVTVSFSSGLSDYVYFYIRPSNETYLYIQNIQTSNGIEYGFLEQNHSVATKTAQNYGNGQIWKLVDLQDGYYEIHNTNHPTGSYILTSSASTSAGGSVLLSATRLTGNNYLKQKWKIEETPSGQYRIQSAYHAQSAPNLYLTINSSNNRLCLGTWVDNTSYLDEFKFIYLGNDVVFLRTVAREFGNYDLTGHINYTSDYYDSYYLMDKHISVSKEQVVNTTNGLLYTQGILIIMGHGTPYDIIIQEAKQIDLRSDELYKIVNGNTVSANLNCDIIIFAGCSTGGTVTSGYNLPTAAYLAGAEVAIGFENTIYGNEVQPWIDDLLFYLNDGYTISQAINYAIERVLDSQPNNESISTGMFVGASNFRFN